MTDKRAGLGPLLFLLAGFAALVFARPPTSAPAPAKAESSAAGRQDSAEPRPLSDTRSADPEKAADWDPQLRLYEEFFAIAGASEAGKQSASVSSDQRLSERLQRIATRAQANGYQLDFLVALVPDPADSRLAENFDLVTGGIQMALGDSRPRYLYDREWLPHAQREKHRFLHGEPTSADLAGLSLLRGIPGDYSSTSSSTPGLGKNLMAVFLVGETPLGGIQKEAFRQSVLFISRLGKALNDTQGTPVGLTPNLRQAREAVSACPAIRVIGPSSSGSTESLAIAIRSLDDTGCSFHVVTGSATAPGLERLFPRTVTFDRTILPDDVLVDNALSFLHSHLKWDLDHAALAIEEGTASRNEPLARVAISGEALAPAASGNSASSGRCRRPSNHRPKLAACEEPGSLPCQAMSSSPADPRARRGPRPVPGAGRLSRLA
jgi:hypothetical protein